VKTRNFRTRETVLVDGGTLRIGTSAASIPNLRSRYEVYFPGVFENEIPEHTVSINSFRMDRYDVTNERFLEFTIANPEWKRDRIPLSMHNGRYLEHWNSGFYPEGQDDGNPPVK
jgi:formylglycine-generating enzyme required for sulfatase activity